MASFTPKIETFNPSLPDRDPPNFLGHSQGIGSDKQFATLFEGAGNILTGAAQGTDALIQENLKKEARAGVEQVRTLFGVDDATTVASETDLSVGPAAMAGAKDYISRLTSGRQAGTITESHYLGQLNSVVKNLRSRYPGYDEQIDETIQGLTGLNPANSIISALRREAQDDSTTLSDEAKNTREYIETHAKEIVAWKPGFFELPESQQPSYREIVAGVAQVQYNNAEITNISARLDLRAKEGTLDHKDLVSGLGQIAANVESQTLNAGVSSLGGDLNSVNDIISKWKETGEVPSPEVQAEILNQATNLKTNMLQSFIKAAGDRYYDLSVDEKKNIESSLTARVDLMIDAINNEDYGMVAVQSLYISQSKDTAIRQMLEKNGIAAQLMGAKEMVGELGTQLILNSVGVKEVAKLLGIGVLLGRGDPNAPNINTSMTNIERDTDDPAIYTRLMEANTEDILSPETSVKTSTEAINWMFGKDGGLDLSMFDEALQPTVMSKLTTKAVTDRVKELSVDNPEIWKTYSSWVYRNFSAQYSQLSSDIRGMTPSHLSLFDFHFDTETGQLGMVPKQGTTTELLAEMGIEGSAAVPTEFFAGGIKDIQKDVTNKFKELNLALGSLKPVLEAEGKGIGPAVQELLQKLGIPIEGFEDSEEGGSEGSGKQGNLLIGPIDLASYTEENATDLIKREEGFISEAKWDVDAYRVGYGSDTVTSEDGTVQAVTKDTTTTKEAAGRDLERRKKEFQNIAKRQIGEDNWDELSNNIQVAVTSVVYNYGKVPKSLRGVLAEGDTKKIAAAIAALPANPKRRKRESVIAMAASEIFPVPQ